jgi:hypothetical protein
LIRKDVSGDWLQATPTMSIQRNRTGRTLRRTSRIDTFKIF